MKASHSHKDPQFRAHQKLYNEKNDRRLKKEEDDKLRSYLKEQATEERKPDPVVGYLMGRLELHILKDLSMQDPDTKLKVTMSELAE